MGTTTILRVCCVCFTTYGEIKEPGPDKVVKSHGYCPGCARDLEAELDAYERTKASSPLEDTSRE